MKKTIFAAVAALCLMAGEAVFAQTESAPAPAAAPKERPTLEQIAQRKTDRMAERLEFTDAQKKQVYEINLQQLEGDGGTARGDAQGPGGACRTDEIDSLD